MLNISLTKLSLKNQEDTYKMKSPRIDKHRMQQVAVTIRDLRIRKGLSQEKLAKELDVTRSAIHYWEQAKYAPTLENCQALAKYFKVDISLFAVASDAPTMPLVPALLQFADALGEVTYPVLHGGEKKDGDDA